MAGDSADSLPAIVAELRDFATRVLPASPELSQPIAALLYRRGLRRTLAAFALGLNMLLMLAYSVAKAAALALAVSWWLEWTPPGTAALIAFVAFCAGLRLNHLQTSDLWPWLRGRWKLPLNLMIAPTSIPRLKILAIGPFSIAGIALAISFGRASRWIEATACALAGLVAQSILDYQMTRRIGRRLALGPEATNALKVVEAADAAGSRLSKEALYRSAGGVFAAFYYGALVAAAAPALMITAELDFVLWPEQTLGMERWVPNLKRANILGSGHWTQQEKPAEVNAALLEFLSDLR
jgi:pimeloyl-ACP methyl ester carboxylesterase